MSEEFTLSKDQDQLLDNLAKCTKYIDAFRLLHENKAFVDDAFLRFLAISSREHYDDGEYEYAASIADLALTVGDQASTRTKIDLLIAAGQGWMHVPGYKQASIHAYSSAVQEAKEADTLYMVPLGKFVLGQHARNVGYLSEAKKLLRETIEGALEPESEVSQEIIWKSLPFYAAIVREILFVPENTLTQDQEQRLLNEVLALLPSRLLPELNAQWKLDASSIDELWGMWGRAKALSGVTIKGFNPFDDAPAMFSFLEAVRQQFQEREEGSSQLEVGLIKRYSTNVLTDRVINHFPYFSVYVTRDALTRRPDSVSNVVHEFTHYWTFLGSLGGYFSALAVELWLLEKFLHSAFGLHRDPEAGSWRVSEVSSIRSAAACGLLPALLNSQAKMQILWSIWRPWAEGLALFAEMDLDLKESGDIVLPLTAFLAGLPQSNYVLHGEGGDEAFVLRSWDTTDAIAEAEAIQSNAHAHVFATYRWKIYLGQNAIGNENYYFTGYGFVTALWRRWSSVAPELRNSVAFLRALLWLSHSTFDDLLPDWRLLPEAFARDLSARFCLFFENLFNAPAERLAEIATAVLQPNAERYDFWCYLKDGRQDHRATSLWQQRVNALQREFADTLFSDGNLYVNQLANARVTMLEEMLDTSRLHLLSESTCEIRLLEQGSSLICVARSAQGGPLGALTLPLNAVEFEQIAAEAREREDGTAKLFQFALAKRIPKLQYVYVFPIALKYGDTLLVPTALLPKGNRHLAITEDDVRLMQNLLDPQLCAVRAEIAQSVEGGVGGRDHALLQQVLSSQDPSGTTAFLPEPVDLDSFAVNVDKIYLKSFLNGPEEWIDRVRDQRLKTFFPPRGAERSVVQDVIDQLMRNTDWVTCDALAERLSVSREKVEAALDRLRQSAAVLGQDLVAMDGDRMRFVGFRAAELKQTPYA
jgi:hypothetical protein